LQERGRVVTICTGIELGEIFFETSNDPPWLGFHTQSLQPCDQRCLNTCFYAQKHRKNPKEEIQRFFVACPARTGSLGRVVVSLEEKLDRAV